MAEGKAVTTQRAADLLCMSRPFFIKLLDRRNGKQRRVYYGTSLNSPANATKNDRLLSEESER